MLSGGIRKSVAARRNLMLAALLGTSMLATPTLAQTAEEASVEDNAIIVTAQRRAEALEDVPMTVTVLTQDTLSNSGVNSVRDLANVTSGLQLNNSGTYPQPSIRGITTINAGTYENNIATFVDGLYQTTAQVLNMDLPNIQNVQVLKGPQGTLYGRNATGGAILIDTIDPSDEWAGNIEATYGRFNDKRARGYIAGPLTEGVGVSLAGTMRRTDGYYKIASRTTPGAFDGRGLGLHQDSVRMKLKFDLTEDLSITAAHSYIRASDPRGVYFTATENVSSNYAAGTGRDTRPRNLGEVAGDIFALDLRQHESSVKIEYDTGIGTLRSITGYTTSKLVTTFDSGGTYEAGNYSTSRIFEKTLQENVDWAIDAIDNFDIVLGGNYYRIRTQFDEGMPNTLYLAPAGSPPGTPISAYRKASETQFYRQKEAWALFADLTFHMTDRLSLNVGGRYSKETQDVSGYKINYCTTTGGCTVTRGGVPTAVPVGGVTTVAYSLDGQAIGGITPTSTVPGQGTETYKKFTPKVSLRYEIQPGTNVYASWSKGFRAGEWNSVIPGDNPANWFSLGQIGQESVTAYEVGFKHAQHGFRFEIAGFYYDYRDLQLSYTQFVPPTNVALTILQSVPKAKIKGIEGSFDYEAFENFNIRGGATWLHARYGKGAVFNGSGVNVAGTGFNVNSDPLKVFPNITVAQDLSGLQMSRAPDFSAFLGFDYLIPQGDGGLRLAANAKYTSSYVVTNPSVWGGEVATAYNARRALDPTALPNNGAILAGTPYADRANQQRARQGSFVMINASVTWTDPSDHYYVRLWGNNLTNEIYRTHYNPLSTGTYSPIGEPRTYGATIGAKF